MKKKAARAVSSVNPVPSIAESARINVHVARAAPAGATAVGIPVGVEGPVPRTLGLDRAALATAGFEGKLGQTLLLPKSDGPTLVAIGVGDAAKIDVAKLRDAAAAFARAAARHTHLATALVDAGKVKPELAAQAVVEGALLARYSYDVLKNEVAGNPLSELTLIASPDRADAAAKGAERGRAMAAAGRLARDLANAPPAYLTAARMAEVAVDLAGKLGLETDVFDRDALQKLGCGGILGVNAGSTEPPRMIKLTYKPKGGKAVGR